MNVKRQMTDLHRSLVRKGQALKKGDGTASLQANEPLVTDDSNGNGRFPDIPEAIELDLAVQPFEPALGQDGIFEMLSGLPGVQTGQHHLDRIVSINGGNPWFPAVSDREGLVK
jgi:hypothetical protein